jgi:protein-L-isoaspartate(D-aspartate) O-methyltransferase
VLAELGAKVFSIERQKPLHQDTRKRLGEMGYRTNLFYGDGYKGLPLEAPFARVIVTCGAPEVPQALLQQLKVGGVLVVPVGGNGVQRMLRIVRRGVGTWDTEEHGAFSFVPMLADKEGG